MGFQNECFLYLGRILVDLYVIIVIMVIFVGQLSDRIKYFVIQNEILLVLTNRPALFVKTA